MSASRGMPGEENAPFENYKLILGPVQKTQSVATESGSHGGLACRVSELRCIQMPRQSLSSLHHCVSTTTRLSENGENGKGR